MSQEIAGSGNFMVTSSAVNMLVTLGQRFSKPLCFHIFVNNQQQFNLRVHDKHYASDWILDIDGVRISFCKKSMKHKQALILDCNKNPENDGGFEFMLKTGREKLAELDSYDAISRILSTEVEYCEAYAEYCYTIYS